MEQYMTYGAIACAAIALLIGAFVLGRKWKGPSAIEAHVAAKIAHAALQKAVDLQKPPPPLTAVEQAALDAKAATQASMNSSLKALALQLP